MPGVNWRSVMTRLLGTLRARVLALACVLICALPAAFVAGYPVRPVNLVVAFPPGGPSDVLARIIGRKLEQFWVSRS